MQYTCLLAVQRILKYGRETDRMRAFAGSFMITDDLVVTYKPSADRDGPGDALPIGILRQLFNAESLRRLRAMNADLPRLVRIAAETGRRPGELVSLRYSCLDLESVGGPYLLYTESKVTGGQQRRLPVLDVVVTAVHEQQELVRQRFPGISSTELRLFPRPTMNPRGVHPFSSATFGKNLRTWIDALPRLDSDRFAPDGAPVPFARAGINAYSFRHTYAQRHADAGTPPDVLRELMGHEKIETTMGYYRIPQKRRREAAEIVGNLMVDGDALIIGPMGQAHRLADQRSTIAVPFGKCSNPQNVAAEGYGCPIRHRCFGCASFRSDPSYLPEMRRRLLDLKATRARVDAFQGAAEWAKRDARPSDDEIDALQRLIRTEEDTLAHATDEQRALIDDASAVLRKARALGQVAVTLRRPNGEDALAGHLDDRRHSLEVVGEALDR
jgi:integrase